MFKLEYIIGAVLLAILVFGIIVPVVTGTANDGLNVLETIGKDFLNQPLKGMKK